METTTEDLTRLGDLDRLLRLVRDTADAMGSASPRAMRDPPFRRFAVQYNRVRAEAARLLPGSTLLPPRVPTGRKIEAGDAPVDARYLEVRAYYAQLRAIVEHALAMEC